VGTN